WSSTLNIAFGRASVTVPSISSTSFLLGGLLAMVSRRTRLRGIRQREPKVYQERPSHSNVLRRNTHQAATAAPTAAVSTTGPPAVQARVWSKCADRLLCAVTTDQRSAKGAVSARQM